MPRQRSLPEILADDTGRIRPEVADLLMEPAPPEPHPHQAHRETLLEVPRESFSNTILFFLGLMLFSVLCLWGISYNLSSKAAAMEEKQASNSATPREEIFIKKIAEEKPPPVSHQEKIESAVIEQPVKEKKVEEEKPKSTQWNIYKGFSGGCR